MTDVFLDTAFAVALASSWDQHHAAALRLSYDLEGANVRIVTTRAVVLEIGNGLSRHRSRAASVDLVSRLHADSRVEIIELSKELYEAGFGLYRSRADKEWGLTDCTSFVVMWERGITDALTTDGHFRQAGFRPLLSTSIR